jgi:membrane protein involved in colicin uptake
MGCLLLLVALALLIFAGELSAQQLNPTGLLVGVVGVVVLLVGLGVREREQRKVAAARYRREQEQKEKKDEDEDLRPEGGGGLEG